MEITKVVLGIALMIVSVILIICNMIKDKPEKPSAVIGTSTYMNGKTKSEKTKVLNMGIWCCIACIMALVLVLHIC